MQIGFSTGGAGLLPRVLAVNFLLRLQVFALCIVLVLSLDRLFQLFLL